MLVNSNWAVVTGASSGIGAEFARHLSQNGYNLVLTARRLSRLEDLAATLPTQTKIVAADLSLPNERELLWQQIAAIDQPVALFVNNAGFGLYGEMSELSRERQLEMTTLNITALTDLAHRYINLCRQRRIRGELINVASVAGMAPSPKMAVYSATKAYVIFLSLALAQEVKSQGIRVLALCPGPIPTEFQEVAGTKLKGWKEKTQISAHQAVEEAMEALAMDRQLWVPGKAMRLAAQSMQFLPTQWTTWFMKKALSSSNEK